MKTNLKAENRAQLEAFSRMKGSLLEIIDVYAVDFRTIIREFKLAHEGRVPTADDLIWIASEHQGGDITKRPNPSREPS